MAQSSYLTPIFSIQSSSICISKKIHMRKQPQLFLPSYYIVIWMENPSGNDFHYRSVIGKLNLLEKSTRNDVSYSVKQCACFSEAVKRIGWYLKGTCIMGLILRHEQASFDCWVDSDYSGNWRPLYAAKDPMITKNYP